MGTAGTTGTPGLAGSIGSEGVQVRWMNEQEEGCQNLIAFSNLGETGDAGRDGIVGFCSAAAVNHRRFTLTLDNADCSFVMWEDFFCKLFFNFLNEI